MYMVKQIIPAVVLTLFSGLVLAQTEVKHQWPDGSVYEGHWSNGQPQGFGTLP